LYNPIAEIFIDRVERGEAMPDESKVVAWRDAGGVVKKTLFHSSNGKIERLLCGDGAKLAPENRYQQVDAGWVYLNGPVRCQAPARG